jgi:hypothetical protein
MNMDLLTGGAFHEGVNHLLLGSNVDEAVGRTLEGYGAWKGYWPQVKSVGLALEAGEDASYVYYEQAALIEALIRGYDYFALPQIKERFEIVEAERDESAIFSLQTTVPLLNTSTGKFELYNPPGKQFDLVWGMRGDALLMDKDTLGLYILSLKTKKVWKPVHDEEQNRRDMQGMSEIATVEQRLGRWQKILDEIKEDTKDFTFKFRMDKVKEWGEQIPSWFFERWKSGAAPLIDAVKMEFALKGIRKEYPEGSGRYTYFNPLIRPFKKAEDLSPVISKRTALKAISLGQLPYAIKWNFQDDLGGNHTLGKGWRSTSIWEDIGVKEWMGILAHESIQGFDPGYGIQQQFVLPMEYYRNEEDIDRWKRTILYEERRLAKGRQEVFQVLGQPGFEEKLDEHFPMHPDYPTDCYYCQFKGLCYGSKGYMYDPLSSLTVEPRTPNHDAEKEI